MSVFGCVRLQRITLERSFEGLKTKCTYLCTGEEGRAVDPGALSVFCCVRRTAGEGREACGGPGALVWPVGVPGTLVCKGFRLPLLLCGCLFGICMWPEVNDYEFPSICGVLGIEKPSAPFFALGGGPLGGYGHWIQVFWYVGYKPHGP